MRLNVSIPVEKIERDGCYSFRHEQMEVEVTKIVRWRADRYRQRYYYIGFFKAPPQRHPEAHNFRDGLLQASINRKLNPKFRPPRDGWVGDVYVVEAGVA